LSERLRKLILFDIDGTLLLTGGAGKLAFNHAFLKLYGIDDAWRDIHPDGRTDPSLIEELFEKNFGRLPSASESLAVTEAYGEAMPEALLQASNFRLMPGVPKLLTYLAQRRLGLIGLATGNFERTARQKLLHGGLQDYFSFGGFGSDHVDRFQLTKLAVQRGIQLLGKRVSPEEILLIGDTVHDIDCGRRLGITTVAVATGSTAFDILEKARPDFLFRDFSVTEEVGVVFE
jgi:phosphoglycolate phosphatase